MSDTLFTEIEDQSVFGVSEKKNSPIYDTEPTESQWYRVKRIPAVAERLRGVQRRFAVELSDESLAQLDFHPGDIFITHRYSKPILNRLMVLKPKGESGYSQLVVREIVPCDCGGDVRFDRMTFHLKPHNPLFREYCSLTDRFSVVGLVTQADKRTFGSVDAWNGAERQLFWKATPDGRCYLPPHQDFRSIWGEDESCVEDFRFFDLIHPNWREEVRELWSHSVRTLHPYEAEFPMLTKRGLLWLKSSAMPILDDDGNVVKWSGIVRVSKNKEIEVKISGVREVGLIG